MEHKNEEIWHTILRIIVILAIMGSILLLVTKRDAGPDVAFDLLAYVISVTALVLTTLQSISIARQVRITRHAAAKVTESINRLDELTAASQHLTQVIEHDTELDEKIVAALSEHAVGKNASDRAQIAKTVRKHVKRHLETR